MSGDVERPPARLKGREEHRNGKWKKCSDGARKGGGEGPGGGESNDEEENEAEK